MRFRSSAAVAISVATAGLCAAGCGPSSGNASGTPTATAASQSSATAASQPTSAPSSAPAASGGAQCSPSQTRIALGSKGTYKGSNSMLTIDYLNVSTTSCTLDGYPGVDLVGTVNGKSYRWPLQRGTAISPSQVTIPAGGYAHFSIVYLPWSSGNGTEIDVNQVVTTMPNTYTQSYVPWSQPVLLQDSATHSGTWIEPVQPGE